MIYDKYNRVITPNDKLYKEILSKVEKIIQDGEKQHEMAILTLNKIKATISQAHSKQLQK